MRVIAGTARSLKLIVPEGKEVRPTLDRTKETLFNMIHSRLQGCIFLDLFSGCGGIGIESLSRGAKKTFFVEKANEALHCIETNLNHTKLRDQAEIFHMDYEKAIRHLSERGEKMDMIFLDPPFHKGLEEKAISQIISSQLLNQEGLLICESGVDTSFDFLKAFDDYYISKEKAYKTSKFTFIEKKDI